MSNITNYEFNKIMEFFRNKTVYEENANYMIKILKKEKNVEEENYRILGNLEFDVTKQFVKGKIPVDIIFNLYDKYNNDGIFEFSIEDLIDNFLDDELVEKRNKILKLVIDEEEKLNLLVKEYNHLYERDDNEKYLEYFSISTKEVLIDFIIEIINYNRKIRNLNELSNEEKENLMLQIKAYIIEKSNPNIITSVWLNKIDYPNNKSLLINKKLQTKINELDKIINPFLTSNILLNNIRSFNDILDIKIDVSDKNCNRFNDLIMKIKRKDTLDEVSYKRNEEEIKFSIKGNIDNSLMFFEHKYKDNNEVITYELKGDNYIYIELNLNNNTIFKTTDKNYVKNKKEFHFIDEFELNNIIILINNLINYTNGITLDNMNDNIYLKRNFSNRKI